VAGAIARGDIRLYRFSRPDRERPVVILTRERAVPYLARVTVAPITSTIRSVPSEVRLSPADGMKGPCAVNLYNLVTVPKRHLGRRVGLLSAGRMSEICAALAFALGCAHDLPAALPVEVQTLQ
jgi:mRNA interferase MazF